MIANEEGQGTEQQERNPPKRKPVIIRVFRTFKRQRHKAKRKQTEHQKNEKTTARWTRRMGLFTFFLVLLTGFTALILYRTDETLKVSERAVVVPYGFSGAFAAREANQLGWIISLQLQNTGGSATKELKSHLRYLISKKDLGESLIFDPSKWQSSSDGADIPGLIGPKQQISANAICIRDDLMRQIREGKRYFYMAGWVTYADTFSGETRVMQFCDQIVREIGIETVPNIRKHTDYSLPIAYRFCQNAALNCSHDSCDGDAANKLSSIATEPSPVRNHTFGSFCIAPD